MEDDLLDVIEIGSFVTLDKDIPATVTAISIRSKAHAVSYECTWWDERNRKTEWVTPEEVQPRDANRRTLRFTKGAP